MVIEGENPEVGDEEWVPAPVKKGNVKSRIFIYTSKSSLNYVSPMTCRFSGFNPWASDAQERTEQIHQTQARLHLPHGGIQGQRLLGQELAPTNGGAAVSKTV